MPMRCGLVVLGGILIASAACRSAPKPASSVRLPAGYQHEGVKPVFIFAASDSYADQLALQAVEHAIRRYSGLFLPVPSVDQADMVMQVFGARGMASQGSGVGIGIGPVALGRGGGNLTPSTELSISVSLRETAQVIYENLVVVPRHPNVGMPKAAAQILAAYASGR